MMMMSATTSKMMTMKRMMMMMVMIKTPEAMAMPMAINHDDADEEDFIGDRYRYR